MIRCPKCESYSISGPSYRAAAHNVDEHLVYRCLTCGYSRQEPTRDNQARQAAADVARMLEAATEKDRP